MPVNRPHRHQPMICQKVRYTLTWLHGGIGWSDLSPREINNWGDVAGWAEDPNPSYSGWATAFAYHAATDATANLNLLNLPWLDLNAADEVSALQSPGTWIALQAVGINDAGDIVGSAANINDPNLNSLAGPDLPRAFILQNAFNNPLFGSSRFLLLPTPTSPAGLASSNGGGINNYGEAVGSEGGNVVRYQPRVGWPVYDSTLQITFPFSSFGGLRINDDSVVVSGGYRQTFAGTLPNYFPNCQFWGLSNNWIGGQRVTRGKIKGGIVRLPINGAASAVELVSTAGKYSRDINNQGVLVFEMSAVNQATRGFVYYDAINPTSGKKYGLNGDGVLPLDKLVENQDADWLNSSYIRVNSINDIGPVGFGQICGVAQPGYRGFLLTPRKIP